MHLRPREGPAPRYTEPMADPIAPAEPPSPYTKNGRVIKTHVCTICSKVFHRSEHRLRHERAHRQEKPFGCRYCHKTFGRKDLKDRHEKTLHTAEWVEPEPSTTKAIAAAKRHKSRPSSSSISYPNGEMVDANAINSQPPPVRSATGLSAAPVAPMAYHGEHSNANGFHWEGSDAPYNMFQFGTENNNSHNFFDGNANIDPSLGQTQNGAGPMDHHALAHPDEAIDPLLRQSEPVNYYNGDAPHEVVSERWD